MAINFTDSPADGATQVIGGRTYTYNSTKNKWDTTATEVTGPTATVYANVDALPTSGNITGAQAYVSGNNRLYIWNGTGWYNIALINTAPSISGVNSSYALAIDGTATTVTITATDPEGLPITYSIASDTSGNIATVTQSSNVFTITPSTSEANAGTFSLTFRASDGVNLATAVAEFTLAFRVSNSNYTDSSSNSHTVTANGNVNQSSFSPYRSGGYSTYFDGSGDYLSVPNDTSLQLGNSDFTIEAWIHPTSIDSGGTSVIMGKYNPSPNLEWYLGFTSSVLRIRYSVNGTSVVGNIDVSYAVSLNTWTHIAVSRTGNNLKFFADGVQIGSDVAFSSTFYQGTGAFGISNANNDDTSRFIGNITDLRVVKGTAVYTANFTPPTERLTAITNTSLLACHLPYFADGSTNNHTITPNGNAATKPFAPYDYKEYTVGDHGGSGYFDSNSSYLTTPDSDDWYMDGDFTIEFWFYKKNTGAWQMPFSQRASSTAELRMVFDWASGDVFSAGTLMVEWEATRFTVSGTHVYNDVWNHIVLQRSGTNVYVYINGVLRHAGAQPSTLSNYSAPLYIGNYTTNSSYDIKGNLTDFRWVKGTAVYSISGTVGDKLFTPPIEPLTAVTDTKLLLNMQDAKILDKSQSTKNLTLVGNTTASTAQYKYLPSSIYFDGSGDYIRCDDAFSSHTSVTQPYTIEMWSRVDSGAPNATFEALLGINRISDGSNQLVFSYTNSDYTFHYSGNSVADSGANLTVDSWEHIAIVGNDGTNGLAIYVNGVQAYTTSTLLDAPLSECSVMVGAEADGTGLTPGNYYQGYMSDIRFTTGLARYTANFTPPSAALDG